MRWCTFLKVSNAWWELVHFILLLGFSWLLLDVNCWKIELFMLRDGKLKIYNWCWCWPHKALNQHTPLYELILSMLSTSLGWWCSIVEKRFDIREFTKTLLPSKKIIVYFVQSLEKRGIEWAHLMLGNLLLGTIKQLLGMKCLSMVEKCKK